MATKTKTSSDSVADARSALSTAVDKHQTASQEFDLAIAARKAHEENTANDHESSFWVARHLELDEIVGDAATTKQAAYQEVQQAQTALDAALDKHLGEIAPDLLARRHSLSIEYDTLLDALSSKVKDIQKINQELFTAAKGAGRDSRNATRIDKMERVLASSVINRLGIGALREVNWIVNRQVDKLADTWQPEKQFVEYGIRNTDDDK